MKKEDFGKTEEKDNTVKWNVFEIYTISNSILQYLFATDSEIHAA